MKSVLLIVTGILFSSIVLGQISNEVGMIYFKDGSSMNGSITYYFDQPDLIILVDTNEVKHNYPIADIGYFKINSGKKFITRDYSNEDDRELLVMQSLIESSQISLYMRYENGKESFYAEKDINLVRLENNISYILKDDYDEYENVNRSDFSQAYAKKEDFQYIGVLSSFMADRTDLVEKLQNKKIKLTENDLTDIILLYNQGNVTYYQRSHSKHSAQSNWMAFAQYSNLVSFRGKLTYEISYGFAAGLQYYFKKNNRNSIKMSFDYASYEFEGTSEEHYSIGLRYQYDFYKSKVTGLYFLFHLADITSFNIQYKKIGSEERNIAFSPRISPGVGIELNLFPQFYIAAEMNQLLSLEQIPKNFSLGLKYDFGSVAW